jgi:hypothetical protein
MVMKRAILVLFFVVVVANLLNSIVLLTFVGKAVGTVSLCMNAAPIISSISDKSAMHNDEFIFQVSASHIKNNSLTYVDNTSIFNVNSTTGLISFTPDISNFGNHTILISVRDNGTGCPSYADTKFNLEIKNAPPVLNTTIPNIEWEKNVQLTGLDLDNYFSDSNGDILSYSSIIGNNITVVINNTVGSPNKGKVIFIPDTGWEGVSWVIFIANDTLSINRSNNVTLRVLPFVPTPPGGGSGGGSGSRYPGFDKDYSRGQLPEGYRDYGKKGYFGKSINLPKDTYVYDPNIHKFPSSLSEIKEWRVTDIPLNIVDKDTLNFIYQPRDESEYKQILDGLKFYEVLAEVNFQKAETKLSMVLPTTSDSHSVTFKSANLKTKEVIFIFESEPLIVLMKEGESRVVDVDRDGIFDVSIKVNKIISTSEVETTIKSVFIKRECKSDWSCNLWEPERCPISGLRKRTCVDLNGCGEEINLPLIYECVPAPQVQKLLPPPNYLDQSLEIISNTRLSLNYLKSAKYIYIEFPRTFLKNYLIMSLILLLFTLLIQLNKMYHNIKKFVS